MRNRTKGTPQILIGQGRHAIASYRESAIPDYRRNPFIAALPPILTENQAIESLARYPKYDKSQRQMPTHLRLHAIQSSLQCFISLPIHLDLEQRFSRMIRAGYQNRNPMTKHFWKNLDANCKSLGNSQSIVANSTHSVPLGFTIIGFPGVGKTTSVEAILSLYPQVIYHSQYAGREFNVAQVVWLKLECPFDGSPKGLCLNFFQAIDQLLRTNYEKNYAGSRRTTDELLPKVARVAAIHGIGVLVIDEINRLAGCKSAGSMRLLSFFVQLTNSIGLPVVLVGTFKAKFVLSGEFHQIRRGTGQGDLVWDRMEEGEWIKRNVSKNRRQKKNLGVWQLFLESLWIYQYTHIVCPLTKELAHTLYEETQGITDFAAKIYVLAQIRAIVTSPSPSGEVITPDVIRSVARDSLRQAQPVLAALRRGDTHYISTVPDINPIKIDDFVRHAGSRPGAHSSPATPGRGKGDSNKSPGHKSPRIGKGKSYEPTDLRAGIINDGPSNKSVFETLDQAGHIAGTTEYLAE